MNVSDDRIDRFLTIQLSELGDDFSRSRIKALILGMRLTENGQTLTDPASRVKPSSVYKLLIPPPVDATPKGEKIPLDILFEDNHLIVLNKPSGLVVHPAPGSVTGTLVNALINHCGASLTGIGGVSRPGIVHRLDKNTSGTMVVAKTDVAHKKLSLMFAARDLDRRYEAIAWGVNAAKRGSIDAAIGRDRNDRKRQKVRPDGRYAITHWRTLRALPPFASHFECRLETGRTHQIRVHLAHIGHGLIGDPLYGRAPRASQMPDNKSKVGLTQIKKFSRQALHASVLSFNHPIDRKPLSFHSPLPRDMEKLLTLVVNKVNARVSG